MSNAKDLPTLYLYVHQFSPGCDGESHIYYVNIAASHEAAGTMLGEHDRYGQQSYNILQWQKDFGNAGNIRRALKGYALTTILDLLDEARTNPDNTQDGRLVCRDLIRRIEALARSMQPDDIDTLANLCVHIAQHRRNGSFDMNPNYFA